MKHKDLLLAESLTEAQYKALPPEQQTVWLCRPTREKMVRAKHFMYFRVALLIAAMVYYYWLPNIGEERVLVFMLLCYECAYYSARQEKSELDYVLAREEYIQKVLALHD